MSSSDRRRTTGRTHGSERKRHPLPLHRVPESWKIARRNRLPIPSSRRAPKEVKTVEAEVGKKSLRDMNITEFRSPLMQRSSESSSAISGYGRPPNKKYMEMTAERNQKRNHKGGKQNLRKLEARGQKYRSTIRSTNAARHADDGNERAHSATTRGFSQGYVQDHRPDSVAVLLKRATCDQNHFTSRFLGANSVYVCGFGYLQLESIVREWRLNIANWLYNEGVF